MNFIFFLANLINVTNIILLLNKNVLTLLSSLPHVHIYIKLTLHPIIAPNYHNLLIMDLFFRLRVDKNKQTKGTKGKRMDIETINVFRLSPKYHNGSIIIFGNTILSQNIFFTNWVLFSYSTKYTTCADISFKLVNLVVVRKWYLEKFVRKYNSF
jgi:stalled ribosome alternative rescue factor ArfA